MKLKISEVSKKTGVHRDTIRALERRGLIHAQRDINGWRRYSPDVVEQIRNLYATGNQNPETHPRVS